MKKSLGIFTIVLLLSVSCLLAQDKINREKPDFSGTWALDKKASTNYVKHLEDYTLKISASGKKIQISRNYKSNGEPVNFTLTLFPDQTGEKNLIPFGTDKTEEIRSETYWKNDWLYRNFTFYAAYDRNNIFQTTERYKLSKDGEKLTIYSQSHRYIQLSGDESADRYPPLSTKLVFRKMEG